jgi:hypothetical protein
LAPASGPNSGHEPGRRTRKTAHKGTAHEQSEFDKQSSPPKNALWKHWDFAFNTEQDGHSLSASQAANPVRQDGLRASCPGMSYTSWFSVVAEKASHSNKYRSHETVVPNV